MDNDDDDGGTLAQNVLVAREVGLIV